MKDKTIIIGIDPGIERLGIAILEKNILENPKEKIIFSECFKTSKNLSTSVRLHLIHEHVTEILVKYNPDIAVIEKIFFTVNQKTAIIVAEARGVVMATMGLKNIDVMELSPTEIKECITGNGNSKKEDIARMLPKIIKLPEEKTQDDELDAIAAALTCSSKLRYSQISSK